MPVAAVIGAVGAVAGGAMKAKGAKKAAKAQQQGEMARIMAQQNADALARADREPWRAAGVAALPYLQGALGIGGGVDSNAAFQKFRDSTDYQFRVGEANKALERSAAARGGLLSGAALRGTAELNQNLGRGAFVDWYNRLAGLAGIGQTAAENNAAGAMQLGRDIGQAHGNIGQARATSYQQRADAWAGALKGVASAFGNAGIGGGGGWGG